METRHMVGQAILRALEFDLQHITAEALGEAGDAAPLQRDEVREGTRRSPRRIVERAPLLVYLLAWVAQPRGQGCDLAAPEAQPRPEREAEPLAAVVERLRLGADQRQRVGQAAR